MATKKREPYGFIRVEQAHQYHHYRPEEINAFDAWFTETHGTPDDSRDQDDYFTRRAMAIGPWMARADLRRVDDIVEDLEAEEDEDT